MFVVGFCWFSLVFSSFPIYFLIFLGRRKASAGEVPVTRSLAQHCLDLTGEQLIILGGQLDPKPPRAFDTGQLADKNLVLALFLNVFLFFSLVIFYISF